MPDTPDSCGADLLANTLLPSLVGDNNFTLPDVNLDDDLFKIPDEQGNELFEKIEKLTNEDLTTRVIGGDGTFDALMDGLGNHLKSEYQSNRITGQEYTKAYIGLVEAAMSNATQYLLGRDQAFWQAVMAQQQARLVQVQVVKARVELETAKTMLIMAKYQALQAEVEYGLTKMKIATEDATFCNMQAQTRQVNYNTLSIMPATLEGITLDNATKSYTNVEILPLQKEGLEADNIGKVFTNTEIMPLQRQTMLTEIEMLEARITSEGVSRLNVQAQTRQVEFNTDSIMPEQLIGLELDNATKTYTNTQLLPAQRAMLQEQVEVQRAQTLDIRTDGETVTGSVGKQKELYSQQIVSYKRDAEVKAAKLFTDAWITQKTLDEGLLAPNNFTNVSMDEILGSLKINNEIGTNTPPPVSP